MRILAIVMFGFLLSACAGDRTFNHTSSRDDYRRYNPYMYYPYSGSDIYFYGNMRNRYRYNDHRVYRYNRDRSYLNNNYNHGSHNHSRVDQHHRHK